MADRTAVDAEIDRYRARTPESARLAVEGQKWLPGGDTRTTLHHAPYPLHLASGDGSRVWDADGNELVDFAYNHTALVHGNRFPPVLAALTAQLERGTCFSLPVPAQVDAGRAVVERVPSIERVRFCNSGTEATLLALRVARAATGRSVVAKVEGAYHGSHDEAMVSTHPPESDAGPTERPCTVPASAGLAPGARDVVILPFDDPTAVSRRIAEVGEDLAAVIVEPIMGSAGMLSATPEYLAAIRRACDDTGALLVFDEVISLRLAPGGAQELWGVTPDLTCLGKMVGGGLPLGAFGGSERVMEVTDPLLGAPVRHPGSMNANPMSLEACRVTVEHLTPDRIERMNRLGDDLRSRLSELVEPAGLSVTGTGSLLCIHTTRGPVRTYRDTWPEDADLRLALFLGLANDGVLIDPRGAACLSTVTTEADCDRFATALDAVLQRNGLR